MRAITGSIVVLIGATLVYGAEFEPSPRFTGDQFPAAPKQSAAWEVPATKLPEKLVTSIAKLFEQGLSDPRGCEYRELSVATGSCWSGDAGVVKTHGWLIPGPDEKQRFAVCWNGIIYPIVSVGVAADFKADVMVSVNAEDDRREKQNRERPDWKYFRLRHAVPEPQSVSFEFLQPA